MISMAKEVWLPSEAGGGIIGIGTAILPIN